MNPLQPQRLKPLLKHIFAVLVSIQFILSGALALTPEEQLSDPAAEARARALAAELRCLVCQNQALGDSDAPLARDMRQLIRQRITAGESDQQIIAWLRQRYGDFILLRPPLNATTMALWFATPAFLLIGIGIILYTRRRRHPFVMTSRHAAAGQTEHDQQQGNG